MSKNQHLAEFLLVLRDTMEAISDRTSNPETSRQALAVSSDLALLSSCFRQGVPVTEALIDKIMAESDRYAGKHAGTRGVFAPHVVGER